MFIGRYSQADTKKAKSAIVSEILAVIRQSGGNFCKYGKGAWFKVRDHCAREKVSALLRDLLHTQYQSSSKAKHQKQVQHQNQNKYQHQESGQKQVEGEGIGDSDDCSTTSSRWGRSKDSLGFEYWLEECDDFFDINVFED
jgi:hypothetical protein